MAKKLHVGLRNNIEAERRTKLTQSERGEQKREKLFRHRSPSVSSVLMLPQIPLSLSRHLQGIYRKEQLGWFRQTTHAEFVIRCNSRKGQRKEKDWDKSSGVRIIITCHVVLRVRYPYRRWAFHVVNVFIPSSFLSVNENKTWNRNNFPELCWCYPMGRETRFRGVG